MPAPHPAIAARIGARPAPLVAMHVLDRFEEGHEASYILARAARKARLDDASAAEAVDLAYGALRALNRLDRAVAVAVRGEPARLEPWRRQFLRLAALYGERPPAVPGQGLDALVPWAGALAQDRDRRRDAERQARDAAREARAYLASPPRDGGDAEAALRTGHPAWLVGLARDRLGADAPALLAAHNEDPPLVVRANTLKATREEVAEALAAEGFTTTPTRWSPLGLVVAPKQGAFRTQAFHNGLFEAQDEGSQLVAMLMDAQPGQWVLDACAGAGGKTLLLGAAMANKGGLVALDVHTGRLLELKRRAGRAGVSNYQAYVVDDTGALLGSARDLRRGGPGPAAPSASARHAARAPTPAEGSDAEPAGEDATAPTSSTDGHAAAPDPLATPAAGAGPPAKARAPAHLPRKQYDAVLVDAPCSGLGTLRRTPELRWRQDAASVATYPPKQRAILAASARRVKPLGRLVYATCSIHPDENEAVVRSFLREHPDFEAVEAATALPEGVERRGLTDGQGFLRLWPHRQGTEGFFAAVLRRREG